MKKLKILLFTFLGIALILYSCTEDYFEFDKITTEEWRPNLALPLVNSTLTLADIVVKEDTNGLIQTNPDNGVLEVIYDGSVFSARGANLVNLPNQSFNETVESPGNIPPGSVPATTNLTLNESITFNTNVEVDSLFMKEGNLILTLSNSFRHNLDAQLTLQGFIDPSTNQSLILNYSIPASNGVTPTVRSQVVDLDGYIINMEYGSQNHSTIPIEANVTINKVQGNSIDQNDELTIDGEFRSLDFSKFVGYLGQQTLDLDQDTIVIEVFKNFIDGTFFLSNPFLDVNILNSYGIETQFTFDRLDARNDNKNPSEITVNLPPGKNPLTLNSPPGFGFDTTNLLLVNSNSNIDDVVSFLLKQLIYDAKATFNPSNNSSNRNYLTDTSRIGLDVLLRLPFEGYASGFILVDTIDFNFEGASELESGLIRVRSTNGFPIDAKTQIFFLDSTETVIDSLFYDDSNSFGGRTVFKASQTNSMGETIMPTSNILDVSVNRSRLAKLKEGRYAVIRAELNTEDAAQQNNVRFLPGYTLAISIGVKATILID